MDKKKTIQLTIIFALLLAVVGGTLAYWQWTTGEEQKTNVTFTVTQDFSCSADGGGNISHADVQLAPTSCTDTSRAIKRKVTVSPVLDRDRLTVRLDLWLNVHELGEGLKNSNNFRYVLTTSSNSCTEGTIISEGNFKGRKSGDKVRLISSDLHTVTPTPEEYWLYIWLDKEETSSSTMNQKFNLSLGGVCDEVETLVGDAYALYTEGNNTLTFVRSEAEITKGSTYNGQIITEVYTGFETDKYDIYGAPWQYQNADDVTFVFKDTIRPKSTAYWFVAHMGDYINLENLNMYLVRDASGMFAEQNADLDVSVLDMSSVTNMSYMFAETYREINLTGLDSWDVSNVTDMSEMFAYSYNNIKGISNWDVSNVTYMSGMFNQNSSSSNINLSNWDTSNVTDMSEMFAYSYNNIKGISNWDVSNVTNMSGMFRASNIDEDLSSWDVSNVTNMSYTFSELSELAHFNINSWDVSSLVDVAYMFWCSTVDIDLSAWKLSDLKNARHMFEYAVIESNSGISNWDVSGITNMTGMFREATLNLSLSNWDTSNVTNMLEIFGYSNINVNGIEEWNVSKVTDMMGMFYYAQINTDINLSGWEVNNNVKYSYFNDYVSGTGTFIPPNFH